MTIEGILDELLWIRATLSRAYELDNYQDILDTERIAIGRFDQLVRRLKEQVWWQTVKPERAN